MNYVADNRKTEFSDSFFDSKHFYVGNERHISKPVEIAKLPETLLSVKQKVIYDLNNVIWRFTMNFLEELKGLGADVDDALNRFMNNEGLYKRMLAKLPLNIEKLEVLSFIESGDTKTALENAHTLKGVMGNLSLTPLYKAYTDIVASFRADKPEEAKAILLEAMPVQEKIIACINANNS